MDIETKRKEVTAIIDNIKKHSDRLTEAKVIPMLELSAILSKMNRLKESTIILKYLIAKEQHLEDDEFGTNTLSIPEIDQSEGSTEAAAFEEEIVEVEDIGGELTEGEEIMVEVEVDEEEVQEIEIPEPINVEPTISADVQMKEIEEVSIEDTLESNEMKLEDIVGELDAEDLDQKPDLNEHYSEMPEKSVGDQLQKQPISDLLTSIAINERYLYANELFDGEMDDFKSALEELNQFDSLSEAQSFFNDHLMAKRNWQKDNELVTALSKLVERRFQ